MLFNKLRALAVKIGVHALNLEVGGTFTIECYDKHPDEGGKLLWRKTAKNGVTNVGKNQFLDVMFGATAKPTWYVGLIRDDNYSGLAAGDTMSSHSGWEEGDEYSETTRQEITFNSAASQSIDNSGNRCYFSINATETMKGMFLVDNSTKNGTSGTLFCTALFDGGDESVVSGNVIKAEYTISVS